MTDSQKFDLIISKLETIDKKVDKLDQRMDALEERMDALEKRMDALEKRMDALEERVGLLEKRMDALEERVDSLEKHMDALEGRVGLLEKRMDSLEGQVASLNVNVAELYREIRLTRTIIENEVNHNVKLVAEGHYDLNRKLDDAIHLSADVKAKQEVHDVHLTLHDAKLKEVSGRLEVYASHIYFNTDDTAFDVGKEVVNN